VAAYWLEVAIPLTNITSDPLLDAIYWIEVSLQLEKSYPPVPGKPLSPPTSMLKNAGLGHAHLVQSKTVERRSGVGGFLLPLSGDIFTTIMDNPVDWPVDRAGKEWCADQFVVYWGQFLNREDARLDPQFKAIKSMYDTATATAGRVTTL
jgi:hypothetical protein